MKNAAEIFDQFAGVYQDKYMDVGLYRTELDLFCSTIKTPQPAILDIACGPGNITKYLLRQLPDARVLGIDLAPKMIELAKGNNPKASFQLMDIRDMHDLQQLFAGIVCGFGLPYLSKAETLKLIQDCASLLEPGGLLYISTIEGKYEASGWKGPSSGGGQQLFMYYYEADFLSAALQEKGLEVIHQSRVSYANAASEPTTDLVLIAKRN